MEILGVDVAGSAQPEARAEAVPSTAPASAPQDQAQPAAHDQRPLSSTIGKLFGEAGEHQDGVQISYRSGGPNEIVTVFTDSTSGKEIAQFPSQLLIDMATIFDQHSGVTLDRNA